MTETFKDVFKEKEISPSYTRKRIYEYLEQSKNHPTVDKIFKSLIDELPTLSKTTVYNVLKLFIEKGIVKMVNIKSSEMRYELNEYDHSHFKCTTCGTIYDIPKIIPQYNKDDISGFIVNEEEVNLMGVCPSCQHNLVIETKKEKKNGRNKTIF